jgi:hypothetical protein
MIKSEGMYDEKINKNSCILTLLTTITPPIKKGKNLESIRKIKIQILDENSYKMPLEETNKKNVNLVLLSL